MAIKRTYLVKEVAALSGVTVRALHYYDELGLLTPAGRSDAGYRLYGDDDLLRLQQILIGRELGLSLEAIRRSLGDPGFDRRAALLAQRAELAARAQRAAKMLRSIDAAIAALSESARKEGAMVDLKKIFAGFDPADHEAEAKQRWGNADAYKVSAQRTQSYTEADWRAVKDEQGAIYAAAFALMQAGVAPDDAQAMDVAERHRLSFDRWFYPCSPAVHASLAELWEADARFQANIDKFGAGLTAYLAAAVRANAARGRN
jgi:MerR family transcriptional regulator, thiopeptide resistance regulator